ncbi:MAG TPA: hypothetical protein VGY31_09965 [Terriglobia bacterium]|nr:hypothetical protein [Terriglobia bacterium]
MAESLRAADHLKGQALLDGARDTGWELAVAHPYRPELAAMSEAQRARVLKPSDKPETPHRRRMK